MRILTRKKDQLINAIGIRHMAVLIFDICFCCSLFKFDSHQMLRKLDVLYEPTKNKVESMLSTLEIISKDNRL